jgi:hypothetical protein
MGEGVNPSLPATGCWHQLDTLRKAQCLTNQTPVHGAPGQMGTLHSHRALTGLWQSRLIPIQHSDLDPQPVARLIPRFDPLPVMPSLTGLLAPGSASASLVGGPVAINWYQRLALSAPTIRNPGGGRSPWASRRLTGCPSSSAASVSVCPMPRPTRKRVSGSRAVQRQYSPAASAATRSFFPACAPHPSTARQARFARCDSR